MPADTLAEQFALAWGMSLSETNAELPLTLQIMGSSSVPQFDM